MKNYIDTMKNFICLVSVLVLAVGCSDFLDEEVAIEFDPQEFEGEEAINLNLNATYSSISIVGGGIHRNYISLQEFPTDMTLESGGGFERQATPIITFGWDSNSGLFDSWYSFFYSGIARANETLILIDTFDDIDEATANGYRGQARFIRAFAYYMLHNFFGPTPILEIPDGIGLEELERLGKETPRATEEEYRAYIEADLMFAMENLQASARPYSRASKGSALGLLAKHYLNTKQWENAADAAQQVIDLGVYELYDDYTQLFAIEGEDNTEYLFGFECLPDEGQNNNFNNYISHAFPPNFPIQPNWVNFGAQFRTYSSFFETFETADVRRNLFLTEYVPTDTNVLTQMVRDAEGNALDNARSFKYVPDPNAIGARNGNDVPFLRLSDMYLVKAEALNELNGPNAESIDLIKTVRDRAKASEWALSDFSSQEQLRDSILAERGREFYTEAFRREDLIRHGTFISGGISRGFAASENQKLYPIPQSQIDNNPQLQQNPGY